MANQIYKARIRLPSGSQQDVTVQASSPHNARQMLEAQYGKGSVITTPGVKK